MIKTKRIYFPVEAPDGYRVLVDRLWPRGLTKDAVAIKEWAKDVSPSDALRKSYAHQPEHWSEFREKYLAELADPHKQALLRQLARLAKAGTLTLLYAARDEQRNNAAVLREYLERQA